LAYPQNAERPDSEARFMPESESCEVDHIREENHNEKDYDEEAHPTARPVAPFPGVTPCRQAADEQ
jgi:hypothetical protein